MADIDVKRRSSAGQYNWVWMLLAVVLVGAFLMWLAVASEPREVVIVENDNNEEVDEDPAETVELAQFAASPEQYQGERVHVPEMNVLANLGTEAAWIELPGGVPYLVRFAQPVLDAGVGVQSGDQIAATGTVHLMSDSVLDAWAEQGVIQTESQRTEAEFATSFLEATRVNPAPRN